MVPTVIEKNYISRLNQKSVVQPIGTADNPVIVMRPSFPPKMIFPKLKYKPGDIETMTLNFTR